MTPDDRQRLEAVATYCERMGVDDLRTVPVDDPWALAAAIRAALILCARAAPPVVRCVACTEGNHTLCLGGLCECIHTPSPPPAETRCTVCVETNLPCMGGHSGRILTPPPAETGQRLECDQCGAKPHEWGAEWAGWSEKHGKGSHCPMDKIQGCDGLMRALASPAAPEPR